MIRSLSKRLLPKQSSVRKARRRLSARIEVEALEDRLAPATAAAVSSVTFAQIGDFGLAGQPEQAVANLVKSWNPNFIITTGDNDYGTPSAATYDTNVGQYYHSYVYPYTGAYGAGATTNSFFPTPGEHDWTTTGLGAYLSYFTLPGNGRYYKVSEGPVDLFAIDSNASEPDGNTSTSVQAAWLKSQLAASTASWKIVYFSEAPYSSGTTHGNSTWMQWPFQQWGASVVLSGHEHNYERLSVNGFPYIVNGLGGASIYPFGTPLSTSQVQYNADYGAMLVNATASQITFQFINEAGTVIDTYTMNYALPAAPSGLATSAVSSTQINLTWANNANNATGYTISRSTDGVNFTQIATVGPQVSQYLDSGVSSATYYYQVNAFNAGGISPYSNTASATPPVPSQASGAPSNVTATVASPSQVNLAWTDNSAGQYSFNIERSTDGSTYTLIAAVSPGTSSYVDTGLAANTYYYQVVATSTAGPIGSTVVVSAPLPPAKPGQPSITFVGAFEIDLTWTSNSSNQTGFIVGQSTDGVNFTQIAMVGPSTTSYASIGLAPSTTYYYQVSAYNAAGQTNSDERAAMTLTAAPPAAPSNLTATAYNASMINLAWTSNSAGTEVGFKLYQSPDGVNFTYITSVSQGTTSYQVPGLAPTTAYYYEVDAYNAFGVSAYTNVASATTMTLPAAPSNLTATAASASAINLAWTSNSGGTESGFKIYQSSDGVNFNYVTSVGTGITSYQIGGLSQSTTYYFEIRTYSQAGLSGYSNVASATTMTPPAAPSNLTATAASASAINLAWTSNSGGTESGFKIYQSTDGVTFNYLTSVGTGKTSYQVGALAQTTTYYFEVRAYNTAGYSPYSNVASATTMTLPAAPSNLTATAASASAINLAWTSNSGGTESGFKIYKSTDGVTFNYVTSVGTGRTSYQVGGLAQATTYYFEVRAYNTAGSSPYSNVASATTLTLPAAPSNLTATAVSSSGRTTLAWIDNSSNPEETGFKIYMSTDGVTFNYFNSVGQNVTSWSPSGLTPGGLYYFEVRSYITGVGSSNPSNWAGTNGTTGQPAGNTPVQAEMTAGAYAEPNDLSTLSTVGWSATLGQSATVNVYVDNPDGTLRSDEYASIENAIATLNASGATGLTLVEVFDPTLANIVVENSTNSQIGGQAQGVLGDAEASYADTGQVDNGVPYLQFTGQVVVNIIEGWSWYTGSDPTAIAANQYDYETVALHELGHAVGLNYEDPNSYGGLNGDGYSVMSPSVNTGQVHRQYSSYDVSWLNHLYAAAANPGSDSGAVVTADALYGGGFAPTDEAPAGTGTIGARMIGLGAGTQRPAGDQHGPVVTDGLSVSVMSVSPSLETTSQLAVAQRPDQPLFFISLPKSGSSEVRQVTTTVVSLPSTEPATMALVSLSLPQATPNSRIQSRGGDNSAPALTDDFREEMPSAPSSPASARVSKVPDARAGAASWRAACTAYFAAESPKTDSAPAFLADDAVPVQNSEAAAAVLAVVLGGYWGVQAEQASERRRRFSRI